MGYINNVTGGGFWVDRRRVGLSCFIAMAWCAGLFGAVFVYEYSVGGVLFSGRRLLPVKCALATSRADESGLLISQRHESNELPER